MESRLNEVSPVNKVIYGKKSLVPDCNTLAYRKGKKATMNIMKNQKQTIGKVVFVNSMWTSIRQNRWHPPPPPRLVLHRMGSGFEKKIKSRKQKTENPNQLKIKIVTQTRRGASHHVQYSRNISWQVETKAIQSKN